MPQDPSGREAAKQRLASQLALAAGHEQGQYGYQHGGPHQHQEPPVGGSGSEGAHSPARGGLNWDLPPLGAAGSGYQVGGRVSMKGSCAPVALLRHTAILHIPALGLVLLLHD